MRTPGILLQSGNINAGLWSLFWSDRLNRVEAKLKVVSTVSKEERQRARFQERGKDEEELRDNFIKFRYWQEKCDISVLLQLKLVNCWDKLFPSSNTLEYKNTEKILPTKFYLGERHLQIKEQAKGGIQRVLFRKH